MRLVPGVETCAGRVIGPSGMGCIPGFGAGILIPGYRRGCESRDDRSVQDNRYRIGGWQSECGGFGAWQFSGSDPSNPVSYEEAEERDSGGNRQGLAAAAKARALAGGNFTDAKAEPESPRGHFVFDGEPVGLRAHGEEGLPAEPAKAVDRVRNEGTILAPADVERSPEEDVGPLSEGEKVVIFFVDRVGQETGGNCHVVPTGEQFKEAGDIGGVFVAVGAEQDNVVAGGGEDALPNRGAASAADLIDYADTVVFERLAGAIGGSPVDGKQFFGIEGLNTREQGAKSVDFVESEEDYRSIHPGGFAWNDAMDRATLIEPGNRR